MPLSLRHAFRSADRVVAWPVIPEDSRDDFPNVTLCPQPPADFHRDGMVATAVADDSGDRADSAAPLVWAPHLEAQITRVSSDCVGNTPRSRSISRHTYGVAV